MTTKPTGKDEPPRVANPDSRELRTACEVHTLAQMLYGQMARTNPWLTQPQPLFSQEPGLGLAVNPWTPTWPVNWVGPSYGTIPVPSPWLGFPH